MDIVLKIAGVIGIMFVVVMIMAYWVALFIHYTDTDQPTDEID